MNRTTILFVLIIAALVIASRLQGPSDGLAGTPDDPVVTVDQGDAAMNAAIATAQATLPALLAHALSPEGVQQHDVSLKVALPKPTGGHEHVWVRGFRRNADGSFTGPLDSNVYSDPKLQIGDEITYSADMISDWLWPEDETITLYGGYTMRVLYADGDGLPQPWRFSETPLPDGWEE